MLSTERLGTTATALGYTAVAHTDSMEAEIVLTDRVGVVHTLCMILSRDLLHCEHRYDNGTVSNTFVLTRTGPGPKTLLPIQP